MKESDTDTHAFFLEGSSGLVGINTSTPSDTLTVILRANNHRTFVCSS